MRRTVKRYDNAIMKRIGELQMAGLKSKYTEAEKAAFEAQVKVLYDVWHEVTHEERTIEPEKPVAKLIEGQFRDTYYIITQVNGVDVQSIKYYDLPEVKAMGFEITHIQDR